MPIVPATPCARARELFMTGRYNEALIELYGVLWNDTRDPEAHLLLWEVLEAQRLDRNKLTLLRGAVEEVAFSRGTRPKTATPMSQATGGREVPRFPLSRAVILVTGDTRRKVFAELAVVEVTSIKGAQLSVRSEVAIGETIHLFGTGGEAEETIQAIVRNVRRTPEGDHFRIGVEFAKPAGKWLLPDDFETEE